MNRLLRCLAAALLAGWTAAAAAGDEVRAVYHMVEGIAQATRAMGNIRNHLNADPTAKIVVVAHGAVVAHGTVPELVGTDDRVAFDGPMHMDTAALAAALPASTTISELRAGHYVVTGAEDPMTLSIVAAWCAQHGVRTQDLHVGRRSLEDVVVELVGDL